MSTQQSSNRKNRWVAFIAGAMVVVAGAVVVAGPLDPPAGPVTGTYKTLSEVEPRIAINATNTPGDANSLFRITQPGSYYLTSNVTGVISKSGIEIASNNVTIDLNGYSLTGAPGSLDGISTFGSPSGIILRNGSIRSWGGSGINLIAARSTLFEDIVSTNNASTGIIGGSDATIVRCIAFGNTGNGITLSSSGIVDSCQARDNSGDGIVMAAVGVVTRSVSRGNFNSGIVSTSNGFSSITDNVVSSNQIAGIRVFRGALVARNNCNFNTNGLSAAGILVQGEDNRIIDNVCLNNTRGIDVTGTGNFIARNTCSGNTSNWQIVAGNVALVVNAATNTAISGNSGGTAPGSTDPNANFTY